MGSLKKLYGWYPGGVAWIPVKVDSNGKVVISNLTVTFIEVTSFTNSWVNYGGSYDTAGYCKDSFGFVHLKGLIRSGIIGQSCFTLPVGYRPVKDVFNIVYSNYLVGGLLIITDGTIITVGSNVWLSLSSVSFYVG